MAMCNFKTVPLFIKKKKYIRYIEIGAKRIKSFMLSKYIFVKLTLSAARSPL